MNELLPDLFTWHWFSERHGYDFNGYFVREATGNIVIDPVSLTEETLEALAREGVARIILTNRNHTRDSVKLRQRTGARIAIHPADEAHAAAQGVAADDRLQHGERVGPFEIIDASGKSPGEVALFDAGRKRLIVGDACVGKVPGSLALLPEGVIDDVGRLRASLTRIAETLDFDDILTGDGAVILGGARAALRALVASFPS